MPQPPPLRDRTDRLRAVLEELRRRDRLYVERGMPRVPLQAAIRDLGVELERVTAERRAAAA